MIVGIAGPAGAGKDMVADRLVEHYVFRKLAFAGTLKAMLAAGGMPQPANRDDKELPIPGMAFTWRAAAQTLGTEWGRALDPDIWVKLTMQRAARLVEDSVYGRVVISDVRFENEARAIRAQGGQIIHLCGRSADLGERAGHVSESALCIRPEDIALVNNRTPADLFESVRIRLGFSA